MMRRILMVVLLAIALDLGTSPAVKAAGEGEIKAPPASGKSDDTILGAIRGLSSESPGDRREAAAYFIDRPDARAFDALMRHIDFRMETDEDTRLNAVRAIGEIGKKEAYDPLMKLLAEEPRDTVKWVAVLSLGKLHEPRAFDQLRKWIEGKERPDWRPLAAYSIGYTKDKRALTVLAAALNDPEMRVRRDAARGVEAMEDPEGCQVILAHLEQETMGEPMRAMIRALSRLKCKDALPVFDRLKPKLNTNDGEFKQMDQVMQSAADLITGKNPG